MELKFFLQKSSKIVDQSENSAIDTIKILFYDTLK
jgi:hypothetical protein